MASPMSCLPSYEPSGYLEVPPHSLYTQHEEWLAFLLTTYSNFDGDSADSEVKTLVDLILTAIQKARSIAKKTRHVANQYSSLTNQIARLEPRLQDAKSRSQEHLYLSTWNQLQVYSEVQEMFARYTMELSTKMMDHWIAVDNLHEEFLERHIEDFEE